MLLTRDELAELSDHKLPKLQISWLQSNGIPFLIGAAGYPKVLRLVVEKHLGVSEKNRSEPSINLEGLKKHASRQKRTPASPWNAT